MERMQLSAQPLHTESDYERLERRVNITAHIVVGTPGTMTDLICRRVIDVLGLKV